MIPRDDNEARRNIRIAKRMRKDEKIKEISQKLGLPRSTAFIYSMGYRNHFQYAKRFKRLEEHYRKIISLTKKKLDSLGYPFEDLRYSNGSLIMKLSEKYLPVKDVKQDIKENLEENIDILDLDAIKENLRVSYYCPRQYSIKSLDIKSRAFLKAYTEAIRSLEIISPESSELSQ
jgi:hypothetical protein